MSSRSELRLGLAMRGGVSLAVWIGGACVEIDELRRGGDEHDDFWRRLSEACGYDRVVVDVLAGASAGGLNGVLFAAAIRHGFQMKDLEGVWLGDAEVVAGEEAEAALSGQEVAEVGAEPFDAARHDEADGDVGCRGFRELLAEVGEEGVVLAAGDEAGGWGGVR